MAIVPQLKEWISETGKVHIAYVDSFVAGIDNWLIPARAMNMAADEYILWVKNNFNPDEINVRADGGFAYWTWTQQHLAAARKFKNTVNAAIRKAKFTI